MKRALGNQKENTTGKTKGQTSKNIKQPTSIVFDTLGLLKGLAMTFSGQKKQRKICRRRDISKSNEIENPTKLLKLYR